MKNLSSLNRPLIGLVSLLAIPTAYSAEIITIDSFDPNTFFADGITAGIDFDTDSSGEAGFQPKTQEGFLSVPANNQNKSYSVTHNGITFDIVATNANLGNQFRWRNNATAGDLMNDFQQWYGGQPEEGNLVEVAVTLSGLLPNTDYQLSFFTYNVGAGQSTHKFYEGTSSEDPEIMTFTTAGNQLNYSTWKPGITFQINSGSNSQISVTIQATGQVFVAAQNRYESRVTFCGMSVISLGSPPLESIDVTIAQAASPANGFDLEWTSQSNKVYDLLSSTDLSIPISEWAVHDDGSTLYEAIASGGETTTLSSVLSSDGQRFFAVREYVAPPEEE